MNTHQEVLACAEQSQRERAERIELLRTCDETIVEKAVEALGSSRAAANWLLDACVIHGKPPIEVVNTSEGREQVEQLLLQIQWSILP